MSQPPDPKKPIDGSSDDPPLDEFDEFDDFDEILGDDDDLIPSFADETEGDDLQPLDDEFQEEPLDPDAFPDGPDDLTLPDFTEEFFDDETDEWAVLERDETPPVAGPLDLIVLPWQMRAEIPVLSIDLPAVLDPTRATSEWIVAKEPERDTVDVLVRLREVEVRVHLAVRQGDEPGLRLGRDVLAGRIAVRS